LRHGAMSNKIQAGIELITAINAEQMTRIELRNILYVMITKDWDLVGDIIDTAVDKKLIERGENTYRITREASGLKFTTPKITKRNERGICRLCGKQITKCYYADVGSLAYGPFGSS